MSKRLQLVAAASTLVVSLACGHQALAQETPELEEVVVTSQRREQALQDVPVAVTALTALEMERRQVLDIKSIQYATPSLTLAPHPGDPTSIGLGLRGITQSDSLLTLDPAVGVYLDGVYLARSGGGNLNLVDMQRVEVLRGPQGTLFGRNTTGGALNLVSRQPTDSFEGSVRGEVGNYDLRAFTAIVNVPIGDQAAGRLVYQHTEHSGYGRNTFLNRDLGDDNTDFLRGAIRIDFTENWTATLQADYTERDSNEQMTRLVYANPAAGPSIFPGYPILTALPQVCTGTSLVPPLNGLAGLCPAQIPGDTIPGYVGKGDFHDNQADQAGKLEVENTGVHFTLTGDLGFGTFKSITAARSTARDGGTDLDGTPYVLLGQTTSHAQELRQRQFSQEFQLYGDGFDGRLDWIVGAYYFEEHGRDDSTNNALFPINLSRTMVRGEAENKSAAIFAQIGFDILPNLTLNVGVRYTEDERGLTTANRSVHFLSGVTTCQIAPALLDTPGVCKATLTPEKYNYVPFTVGLDFKPTDDILLYGKFSRGFRAGGFSLRGGTTVGAFDPFMPERVDSWEAGAKSEWLDGRLRVNGAAYFSQYTDIQQSVIVAGPTGPATVVRNVGEADIKGAELEVNAILPGELRLNGSVGYVDAEYTSGPNLGKPFQQVPEWTYALAADYPIDIGQVTVNLHADYSWRSEQFFGRPEAGEVGSYGLLNAVVSVDFTEDLTLALWGRNLGDEEYYTRTLDLVSAGLGIITGFQGDPRTVGLALTYRFGQ